MNHKIIICGGNGAGKSTLGRVLAHKTGWAFRDVEDYYFPKIDPDYLYAVQRTQDEVVSLLYEDLKKIDDIIFASVRGNYSEAAAAMFTCAVFLSVPKEIRMKRVRQRAYEKFGDRILAGGDLYEREEAFFDMVEKRSDKTVADWLETMDIPVIKLDGTEPAEKNAVRIINELMKIKQVQVKYMKPILIIYFSGAGNTKAVSEYIKRCADEKYEAEIYSVEKLPDDFSFEPYSAVIIGTPTYHSEPAKPLMDFLGRISPNRNIPAFIFATCGLYPENCLRILGKKCLEHSVIPIYSASYRCSASDGILLAPFMKCWFKNENGLSEKIKNDFSTFINRLKAQAKADMPRYRWYAPLNFPNKMLGKAVTFPIYLHKDRCVRCGKCIRNCPQSAVSDKDGYPVINRADCINCYRCIHHCPVMALSLYKNRAVEKVWEKDGDLS